MDAGMGRWYAVSSDGEEQREKEMMNVSAAVLTLNLQISWWSDRVLRVGSRVYRSFVHLPYVITHTRTHGRMPPLCVLPED